MSLRDDIPWLIAHYETNARTLAHNTELLEIYEGNLLDFVLRELEKELSANAFFQLKDRVPPINILQRFVSKLSKVYSKAPKRTLNVDDSTSLELFGMMTEQTEINQKLSQANEFFNLFKNTWIEPYLENGMPRLRCIPSDRFFVASKNKSDPSKPTHFVKIMGMKKKGDAEVVELHAYTDTEFLAFYSNGEIDDDTMNEIYGSASEEESNGYLYGQNVIGTLPGVYINKSQNFVMPRIDTDTLAMTKLIPKLLADANFCAKFQSFSIIYAIDMDEGDVKMSPNALWRLKSDPTNPTAKPEVGTIKPSADTDKLLALIESELAFWLNTKNIKPGTIGALSVENAASGISKVVDEMDASEDIQKQTGFFKAAEAKLWEILINFYHPYWKTYSEYIGGWGEFVPTTSVKTEFPEYRPLANQSGVIDDQLKMKEAGLQTMKGALKEIYPDWTDEQIDGHIVELKAESNEPKPIQAMNPVV